MAADSPGSEPLVSVQQPRLYQQLSALYISKRMRAPNLRPPYAHPVLSIGRAVVHLSASLPPLLAHPPPAIVTTTTHTSRPKTRKRAYALRARMRLPSLAPRDPLQRHRLRPSQPAHVCGPPIAPIVTARDPAGPRRGDSHCYRGGAGRSMRLPQHNDNHAVTQRTIHKTPAPNRLQAKTMHSCSAQQYTI